MRKSCLSGQYRCWVHVQKARIPTISSIRRETYHVDQHTGFRTHNLAKDEDTCGDLETGFRQYDAVKPRHIDGDPILSPKSVRVPTGFAPIHSTFDPIFLRDCCSCQRCVDPSTSQKLFETAEIPLDIEAEEFRITEKENVVIKWKNDISRFENHDSTFPMAFLAAQTSPRMRMEAVRNYVKPILWDRQRMELENLTIDYRKYLESDAVLHKALTHLEIYGMFYLSDVPSNPKMIGLIANRIGPLRNTFYGPTWDVRSVPSAKNIAYTSGRLGFHMDLLYMQNPPGLQILHCMKASAQGGESLFTDGFRALDLMQEHHPTINTVFAKFPVTYKYKNDGQYYQHTRPTAEVVFTGKTGDYRNKWALREVNWSPPFQAPFEKYIGSEMMIHTDNSRLRMYLLGAKLFKSIAEADEAVFQTKMEEGTCVVFNNRRILHARAAFRGEEGERWLRGAYVDTDSFHSRLRVLNEDIAAEQKAHEHIDELDTVG